MIRVGAIVRLGILILALGAPVASRAQTARPFAVGESAEYDVRYGVLRAGSASLALLNIDTVRGRDAYRFRLTITGGVNLLLYKYFVRDTMQSWVDTASFQSLRFWQDQLSGGRPRTKRYEIFPDRRVYVDDGRPEQPSVADPLDDISFLYFVRTQPLEVGTTKEWSRYFKPASNPVVLKVLRRETIEVAGRKWNAIVVQPIIKTSTMFSDGSEAHVWISDDSARLILQINTKLSIGSITLKLRTYTPASRAPGPAQ